jgi:hypothetical protein
VLSDDWIMAEEAERRAEITRIAAEQDRIEAAYQAKLDLIRTEAQPPCLQKLVDQYGGYDKITLEGWAQFFSEMRGWKSRLRNSNFYWRTHQLEVYRNRINN